VGLRLGHRFVDSANGEILTWFDEHWGPVRRADALYRPRLTLSNHPSAALRQPRLRCAPVIRAHSRSRYPSQPWAKPTRRQAACGTTFYTDV